VGNELPFLHSVFYSIETPANLRDPIWIAHGDDQRRYLLGMKVQVIYTPVRVEDEFGRWKRHKHC
jgi:hypothetical protein